MDGLVLPFHKCKIAMPLCAPSIILMRSILLSRFTPPPFVALAPQQFPIDRGDLLQVIFHLLVILNPLADLLHLIAGDDSTSRFSGSKGDRQIPYGTMPFPFGALASRVAAGHIAFDQRSTQGLSDRRKLVGKTLPALAESQFGKSG